jgi:hypothetical protein
VQSEKADAAAGMVERKACAQAGEMARQLGREKSCFSTLL